MTLRLILDAAAVDIAAHFSKSAVFTPASGDAVALLVDLRRKTSMEPQGFDSQGWAGDRIIEYLYADLGRAPEAGETFTIAGTTYTVRVVLENDKRFCKVGVT